MKYIIAMVTALFALSVGAVDTVKKEEKAAPAKATAPAKAEAKKHEKAHAAAPAKAEKKDPEKK
mgnify:CR=1 FL=1|jgi:hypothetical protein